MTKEEAKKYLIDISYALGNMSVEYLTEKDGEKMREAIETLEQEPCEDAISRQAAIEKIHWLGLDNDTAIKCDLAIRALPSVNPQEPKTGHWIPVSERVPEEYGEYLITWTTSLSKRPFIGISEGQVTNEYDHEHNRFKFEWLLDDYVKNYPDVEVIAWMPLTKPYESQESEDKA